MVGSSSGVWQRSSPALGLQPPTPSVAQLWVALAPQFDYRTYTKPATFLVGLWCKCGGGYHNAPRVGPHPRHTSATHRPHIVVEVWRDRINHDRASWEQGRRNRAMHEYEHKMEWHIIRQRFQPRYCSTDEHFSSVCTKLKAATEKMTVGDQDLLKRALRYNPYPSIICSLMRRYL